MRSGEEGFSAGLRDLFTSDYTDEHTVRSSPLRPAVPTRTTIHLDIQLIERPFGDPLVGPLLWREVSQVGALKTAQRQSLREAGFRVGHASSSPPQILQRLLGMKSELMSDIDSYGSNKSATRQVTLLSGSDAEIQTSAPYAKWNVSLERGGSVDLKGIKNARCVFRIKAEELQSGWARLQFQPEIHHGRETLRPVASASNWKLRTTQNVEPLFDQRFTLELNRGELAVITADDTSAETIAGRFFLTGDDDNVASQRLLIVRLADIDHVKGVAVKK